MSLDFVADVWDALRSHIDLSERKYAADTMVNLLIDNDYEADDIKQAFRGEKEIQTALKEYLSDHESDSDSYDEEDEEDEDDEW